MKSRHFLAATMALLLAAAFGTFGPGLLVPQAHAAQQLYTCGMHPQIIKTEPGNCPICGMKLTPIRANGKTGAGATAGERKIKFYKSTMIPGVVSDKPGKDSHGMDMVPVYADDTEAGGAITIEAATMQKMNLKTDLVRSGTVRRAIRAVGTVGFNEQGLVDITTKYEGWLEKLFVNATWTTVKAGAPLFEIYSPDLYNAQLNYVVALRSEGGSGGALSTAARGRLALFDVPDSFVQEIARTGEARRTLVFRAPSDGVVIEKPAVQGMMVKPGEKIFRLADLSTVWVTAQIYEKDLALVQAGQEAVVRSTYGGDREFKGKVDVLVPEVAAETRTVQARLTIPNPDQALKPGMFVDVRFEAELKPSAVLVPDIAVLRSGERNTVFIAREGGTFEPRELKLGARTQDNFYEVLSGLAAGDRVVTSAQFMLDSESQLREAVQKMLRSEGEAAKAPAAGGAKAETHPAEAAPALDSAGVDALTPLALGLADAANALAADDFAGYRKQLPGVRAALAKFLQTAPASPLSQYNDALPDPADLKAARRDFEPFSTAVADLAVAHHLQHTAGLHVFECPMSPVLGKGRWLQREPGTKNPFFGSKMPRCGSELEAPAAGKPRASLDAPPLDSASLLAARLPAGHPPIAPMTLNQFAASQTGLPLPGAGSAAASGGCGSCGMSAAAMAAGEPCEHGGER